VWVHRSNKIN